MFFARRNFAGRRALLGLAGAAGLALVAAAAPALALVDGSGAAVPNTVTTSPTAQLASGPTLLSKLFEPASPGNDDPGALAALRSPLSPEEDLAKTLDDLGAAPNLTVANGLRQRAIDLLEGNPVSDLQSPANPALYSGMPLLNWNPPSSVKDVPAGGTVNVRVVRFGEHVLTDTSLLKFADPDQPFFVEYEIVELGSAQGGMVSPTPLLSNSGGGSPIGGLHSVHVPLGLPETNTGTLESSRFTTQRGVGPQAEHTRLGVRSITVKMPPPKYVTALLEPNLRKDHEAGAAIRPWTQAREDALGADKTARIAALSAGAPEKQIWTALGGVDTGDLVALKAAGTASRAHVGTMRTKFRLNGTGVSHDPNLADVTLGFLNNEVYSSAKKVHAPLSDPTIRIQVKNTDAVAHTFQLLALSGQKPVFGPLAWGEFTWAPVALGAPATVAAGGDATYTVSVPDSTFALWMGDPETGASAATHVAVDRTPKTESLSFPNSFDMPLHEVFDQDGTMWVTVPGTDRIGKIVPATKLSASQLTLFDVPGGLHTGQSPEPNLLPLDIKVDAAGIVWFTMSLGNSIGRFNPVTETFTVYALNPCLSDAVCRPAPPPAPPNALLTREPLQLDVFTDADGNTLLYFTELAANAIGVMRVAPDGTRMNYVDVPCGCASPAGISVDAQGAVWFTEMVSNRIGRLIPDLTRPFNASTATFHHFPIPGGIPVTDPELLVNPETRAAVTTTTTVPHSLTLDYLGRVWFTQQATRKIGMLDPALASPNTTNGFVAFDLGDNEFGGRTQPADLVSDRSNRVFVTDEYGDRVATVTSGGPGVSYRPVRRQSFTDAPIVDQHGNLYFIEAGAGLLTRVAGVAVPELLPGVPHVITANTADNTVSGTGLRGMTGADIEVLRSGSTVSVATGVTLGAGGTFAVGGGGMPWAQSPSDPVRAGDTVRIIPTGTNVPGPFTFQVVDLKASLTSAGALSGTAKGKNPAGQSAPVFGAVKVDVTGQGQFTANVSNTTGNFSVAGPFNGVEGTLTWSTATAIGVSRTVSGITPEPVEPVPGPGGGGPPPPPAPQPPTPEAPLALSGGSTPPPSVSAPTPPAVPAPDACRDKLWIHRNGNSRIALLLGRRKADVTRCLGRPASRTVRRSGETLRFRNGVVVEMAGGKVRKVVLRSRVYRSDPGGVAVGSPSRALSSATGVVVKAGSAMRSVVRVSGGVADIRFTLRGGKVSEIALSLVSPSRLDAAGKRLLSRTS